MTTLPMNFLASSKTTSPDCGSRSTSCGSSARSPEANGTLGGTCRADAILQEQMFDPSQASAEADNGLGETPLWAAADSKLPVEFEDFLRSEDLSGATGATADDGEFTLPVDFEDFLLSSELGQCETETQAKRLRAHNASLGLPENNDITQFFVRNTFIDTPLIRPESLEEFLTERLAKSCPATRQPTDDDVHALLEDVRKAKGQTSEGVLSSFSTMASKENCAALFTALSQLQARLSSDHSSAAQIYQPPGVGSSEACSRSGGPEEAAVCQTLLLSEVIEQTAVARPPGNFHVIADRVDHGATEEAVAWNSGVGEAIPGDVVHNGSQMKWLSLPPPPPVDWAPTAFNFSFEGQRVPPAPQMAADDILLPNALPSISESHQLTHGAN